MGVNASLQEQTQTDAPVLRSHRHSNEDRNRKRFSKLSTLKRRLTRVKSSFKNHDHGKILRDLTQTWTTQEISDLVDEYEILSQLREQILNASHVRPCTASLTKDLLHLFRLGYCTDATLVYCDTYFPVHKAILSARCSYFRELFLQYPSEEHPVIKVDIKTEGITKEVFSSLLCYLYTGDFMPRQSGLESLELLMHLGDEFGTPNVLELDLKTLLNNGDCADVVLVFPGQKSQESGCEGDAFLPDTSFEIPAHRCLLSSRSMYFRSLFQKGIGLCPGKSNMTRLVIDESVLPRQYARVILQCMYTDSIDLSSVVKWGSRERKDGGTEAHKLLTAVEVAMEVYGVARFVDFPMLAQGLLLIPFITFVSLHSSQSQLMRWMFSFSLALSLPSATSTKWRPWTLFASLNETASYSGYTFGWLIVALMCIVCKAKHGLCWHKFLRMLCIKIYNRLQNSWHTLQNFGIFLMNVAPQLKKITFAKFSPAPPINVDHSFRHYGHFVSGKHCAGGRGDSFT